MPYMQQTGPEDVIEAYVQYAREGDRAYHNSIRVPADMDDATAIAHYRRRIGIGQHAVLQSPIYRVSFWGIPGTNAADMRRREIFRPRGLASVETPENV